MLTVKIIPNDKGNPPGKLADAELHFTDHGLSAALVAVAQCIGEASVTAITADMPSVVHRLGEATRMLDVARGLVPSTTPLDGLKLIGFGIWERRTGGGRNVTFPARTYAINGERRSFALLRPITDIGAHDQIEELILEAYAESKAAAIV